MIKKDDAVKMNIFELLTQSDKVTAFALLFLSFMYSDKVNIFDMVRTYSIVSLSEYYFSFSLVFS